MYGFEVPRNYTHAMELDARNGNTKWKDSTILEMAKLAEFDTFKDMGLGTKPPTGFQKIRVHIVYAVKHDGRHRA